MFAYRRLLMLTAIILAGSAAAQAQTAAGADILRLQMDLCAAVANGDVKAVSTALEKGARVDLECPEQRTYPIFCAVDAGNADIVLLLLDRGADVNQPDNGVRAMPLHYAAQKSDAAMIRLLVKRGAKVNALTDEGLSPLGFAVLSADNVEAVQALTEAGADINFAGEDGDTILDLALLNGRTRVTAYLASRGAKPGEVPAVPPQQVQGTPPSASETAPPQPGPGSAKRTPNGQLIFKGLYLGMPVEEAARKLLDLGLTPGGDGRHGYPASMLAEFPDGVAPHDMGGPWRGTEPLKIDTGADSVRTLRRDILADSWEIQLDTSNRVQQFHFSGGASARMFGSGDMSGEEFAKAFIDAYEIPGLQAVPVKLDALAQYFADSMYRMGWEYVDREHGWKLRIDETKVIILTRMARTADTKFN